MPSPIEVKNIPPAIRDQKRFVLWAYVEKKPGEKPTKVPFRPSGKEAKTDDPASWSTLPQVLAALENHNSRYAGIGAVLYQDDPLKLAFVDLDNCLTPDGDLKNWAVPLVRLFGDPRPVTTAERSPSGRGLHFLTSFRLERGRKLEFWINGEKCSFEAYSQGRYCTITGDRWRNAPLIFGCHQEAVEDGLRIAEELSRKFPLPGKKKADGRDSPSGSDDEFIREGEGRHDAIKDFAVRLRRAGFAEKEVRAAALGFNEHRCRPPYDHRIGAF